MFNPFNISSSKYIYEVIPCDGALKSLQESQPDGVHFIIDKKVSELYRDELDFIMTSSKALIIEANEEAKSLEKIPLYVRELVNQKIRRGDKLIAIGGGVIQDISAFLATTILRGVDWDFYPTTLLSQADSCIGSKSSINVGDIKNILGTYCPPRKIYLDVSFLNTLDINDNLSGIGEMLKVHAIAGPKFFFEIATNYDSLLKKKEVLIKFILGSLKIKKALIELDEFDRGPRNIMNYGHSFGHAIESATDFFIPHGIAVSIGMDMANYVAVNMGLVERECFNTMHVTLEKNFRNYRKTQVPVDRFILALNRDKKNTSTHLTLVLPNKLWIPEISNILCDTFFIDCCKRYFSEIFNSQ